MAYLSNSQERSNVNIFDYACDHLPYTAIPRVIDRYIAAIAGPRDRITVDLFRHLWDMGRQRQDYMAIISVEQLAERLQTTKSSVGRGRNKLKNAGLLHWFSPVREDGSNERTHWILTIPKELEQQIGAATPRQASTTVVLEATSAIAATVSGSCCSSAPHARSLASQPTEESSPLDTASPQQDPPRPPETGPTETTPSPMAPEPDLKVPQSPQVQCESAAEEETLSDAATPVELVPPVLNDETAIVARMTHQERNHFEIMVRLHGHDMRIGLDPDSALTPNDLEAIERYRHEIRRHNAHQARKTASEGGLKGQVGSCDRRHAEGAQADAQLVRERLSQSELVQAAAIADKYALFMGVAFLELYRQIVWHLLFNPQSRRSTFHGLRIAQRLLEQGRWGVPHSMRDDFQPPPPPPRGSERRWGEGVASGRGGGCR